MALAQILDFDRYLDIYLPFKQLAPPVVSMCDKWRARAQAEEQRTNSSSSPPPGLLLAIGIISHAPNWELRQAVRERERANHNEPCLLARSIDRSTDRLTPCSSAPTSFFCLGSRYLAQDGQHRRLRRLQVCSG